MSHWVRIHKFSGKVSPATQRFVRQMLSDIYPDIDNLLCQLHAAFDEHTTMPFRLETACFYFELRDKAQANRAVRPRSGLH